MSGGIRRDAPPSAAALELFQLRGPPDERTLPGLDLLESRRTEAPEIQMYLRGSFDRALEEGTYDGGDLRDLWCGHVCLDAIEVFTQDDVLNPREITARLLKVHHAGLIVHRRAQDAGGMLSQQAWLNAGNLMHYAIRIGQVDQCFGEDGEPRFRIVTRDLFFVNEGNPRRSVQARGLPPKQQATRYRKEARELEKQRVKVDAAMPKCIARVLRRDPYRTIDRAIVTVGGLPEAFLDEPIVSARPRLETWHREGLSTRAAIDRWHSHWNFAGEVAIRCGPRPRPEPRPAPPIDIPPEDADALGAL